MFFAVRETKGVPYLYKLEAIRIDGKSSPTNKATYVGSIEKIEDSIQRWRKKDGAN